MIYQCITNEDVLVSATPKVYSSGYNVTLVRALVRAIDECYGTYPKGYTWYVSKLTLEQNYRPLMPLNRKEWLQ